MARTFQELSAYKNAWPKVVGVYRTLKESTDPEVRVSIALMLHKHQTENPKPTPGQKFWMDAVQRILDGTYGQENP